MTIFTAGLARSLRSGFPVHAHPPSLSAPFRRVFFISFVVLHDAHAFAVSFKFLSWAPVTKDIQDKSRSATIRSGRGNVQSRAVDARMLDRRDKRGERHTRSREIKRKAATRRGKLFWMKDRSIPGSLGRHKPQAGGRQRGEIRADEMARPPLHANLLCDIKAVAMGLRRLVACGDLLGAWTPDNYVPIKFNDCPLFRSAYACAPILRLLPLATTKLLRPTRCRSYPTLLRLRIPRRRIGNNYHPTRNPITF